MWSKSKTIAASALVATALMAAGAPVAQAYSRTAAPVVTGATCSSGTITVTWDKDAGQPGSITVYNQPNNGVYYKFPRINRTDLINGYKSDSGFSSGNYLIQVQSRTGPASSTVTCS